MKKLLLILLPLFFTTLVVSQPLDILIENYTAVPAENFCIQFDVSNFDSIVSTQYTLEWDPSVISFDSLTGIGLPLPENLFYNATNAGAGQLLINWFDPVGVGYSVSDGTTMYELCFTAVGAIGSATTFAFTSFPLQIEVTSIPSGGEDIGIVFSEGTVTIVEPLEPTETTINQPDCINPNAGSIELEMAGGVLPYDYSWSGPGNFTANTEDISGLGSGTYYLTVSDASMPPVFYLDTFEIGALLDVPVVMISESDPITCIDSLIALDATGSSFGNPFEISWLTADGNIVLNANTLNPLVDAAGNYELIINNTENGCSASAVVIVVEDLEEPIADAGEDGHIDCNALEIILDAGASSSNPEYSISWNTSNGNILSGENTFEALVNGAGIYEILVRDQTNGCTATDQTEVSIDTIVPIADAGMDQIQVCFDNELTIDGSASSSGNNISYLWTSTDGNILNNETSIVTQVNQSGSYSLLVTNSINGCTASDFTMINLDEDLVEAIAGSDEFLCQDSFQLNANLPNNNTGVWTSSSNLVFENINANQTMVSNLAGGINQLYWTLSTEECMDYSTDTISLTVEDTPIANEDMFVVPFGANPYVLDVTSNDGILTVSAFSLEIISAPAVGTLIEIPDNQYSLTYPNNYFGPIEFEYRLCNSFCLEYCDTARVILDVLDQQRIDTTVVIPNGITPNGDGINDTFVLPILADNPNDFPESEMIIFNRWGNIVFQKKPYLNDWGGTNESGKLLPQGTYYYVLRLNLAQGEIIKGEVTILK